MCLLCKCAPSGREGRGGIIDSEGEDLEDMHFLHEGVLNHCVSSNAAPACHFYL